MNSLAAGYLRGRLRYGIFGQPKLVVGFPAEISLRRAAENDLPPEARLLREAGLLSGYNTLCRSPYGCSDFASASIGSVSASPGGISEAGISGAGLVSKIGVCNSTPPTGRPDTNSAGCVSR